MASPSRKDPPGEWKKKGSCSVPFAFFRNWRTRAAAPISTLPSTAIHRSHPGPQESARPFAT
ncbi:MAG: hypothetical protein E6Q28_11235 [Afipia sp.]|nr:MAG: hypothetical protein E6Q28_11235 [Afipia sp.]